MIIYIPRHNGGAGKWIYEGYFNAWEFIGKVEEYEVKYYDNISEIDTESSYSLMATEGGINRNPISLLEKVLSNAVKVFMYVQPHTFPEPWGRHPNFVTNASDDFVALVNSLDNIKLWSFSKTKNVPYWDKWKDVAYIPLAFDNIGYDFVPNDKFKYDVCYIGGFANNGFDEKFKIMNEYFTELSYQGISVEGIHVNKNVSLEHEYHILSNSKICLNIHDKYQQELGLDCNERTFKSLGLNGCLVSDKVDCLSDLEGLMIMEADSPKHMAEIIKEYLDKDLSIIKNLNKSVGLDNHTYCNRVRSLLCL